MRRAAVIVSGVALFAVGFVCGHLDSALPSLLHAQNDDAEQLSDQGLIAYQKARKAVVDMNDMFIATGRSTAAATDVNYFSVSVGGIDVQRDLDEGRGVDPETFAALYAFEDQIVNGQKERVFKQFGLDVSQHLDTDDQGRIRYKEKVVQLYSTARLNELFNRRDELRILSSNK
jgi:hypothetical protein